MVLNPRRKRKSRSQSPRSIPVKLVLPLGLGPKLVRFNGTKMVRAVWFMKNDDFDLHINSLFAKVSLQFPLLFRTWRCIFELLSGIQGEMPKDRERARVQDQKVEGKDGWHCSNQEEQGGDRRGQGAGRRAAGAWSM